jgi:hypothetical protein
MGRTIHREKGSFIVRVRFSQRIEFRLWYFGFLKMEETGSSETMMEPTRLHGIIP